MSYQLYHGDCLDVLPTLPDASVDAIITDPPYGTTQCAWDTVIPFNVMWEQLRRVIKPRGVIVLFAAQPFTSALIMSNPQRFKYTLVWEKTRATTFASAKYMPLRAHEDIVIFASEATTYNPQKTAGKPYKISRRAGGHLGGDYDIKACQYDGGSNTGRYPRSVITIANPSSEMGLHPTQKPVALMEYLIRTYTNEGETVLDFTMGSGTTGVAAIQTGRNFIGIEKDAAYYAIAEQRIAQAAQSSRQLALDEVG